MFAKREESRYDQTTFYYKRRRQESLRTKIHRPVRLHFLTEFSLPHGTFQLREEIGKGLGITPHMRTIAVTAACLVETAFKSEESAVFRPKTGVGSDNRQGRCDRVKNRFRQRTAVKSFGKRSAQALKLVIMLKQVLRQFDRSAPLRIVVTDCLLMLPARQKVKLGNRLHPGAYPVWPILGNDKAPGKRLAGGQDLFLTKG